jgi:2-haloacid dehalogenase
MADALSGGAYRPLTDYLRAALERALRAEGRDLTVLDPAMERAGIMDPFPEVGAALSRLRSADLRLGVLTNSTGDAADRALTAASLRDRFELVIGSDEVQAFKPHPRVYEYGVERVGARPEEIVLVAAHGWDVMGAMRAGLRGAWVGRSERWLVPIVPVPDVTGDDLEDVAEEIVAQLARE